MFGWWESACTPTPDPQFTRPKTTIWALIQEVGSPYQPLCHKDTLAAVLVCGKPDHHQNSLTTRTTYWLGEGWACGNSKKLESWHEKRHPMTQRTQLHVYSKSARMYDRGDMLQLTITCTCVYTYVSRELKCIAIPRVRVMNTLTYNSIHITWMYNIHTHAYAHVLTQLCTHS